MEYKVLLTKIRRWIGFYKNPSYVEEYLKEADVRSARNLSVLVVVLEIWMIIRNAVKYHSKFTTIPVYFHYTKGYWILLLMGLVLFIYSVLYLSNKLKKFKKISRFLIFLFFIVGIYFGMSISIGDISKGRMITCFLTMSLMVSLIIIWRPYISFLLTASTSVLFVYLVNHVAHTVHGLPGYMNEGELINYSTFMITLLFLAISMYAQRRRDASKAYSLQKAHEREIELMKEEQEHLNWLFTETAEALVSAIDAKDRYTHGHSTRVAEYSREIAKRAGKSNEEIKEIFFAALLHDVGKIGVSSTIINKNGKLTEDEVRKVKSHSVLGWEILSNITHSPYLSLGAHYHHEKYNGSGYPEGLADEEIPDLARIIAVADAYDAMSSNRSYRNTLDQQTVRNEIEKGMGTQFDPKYAKIMLEMIDEDKDYKMRE